MNVLIKIALTAGVLICLNTQQPSLAAASSKVSTPEVAVSKEAPAAPALEITDENFQKEILSPGTHYLFIYNTKLFIPIDGGSNDDKEHSFQADLANYVKRFHHITPIGTLSYCDVAQAPNFAHHEGYDTDSKVIPGLITYVDGQVGMAVSCGHSSGGRSVAALINDLNEINGSALITELSIKELLTLEDEQKLFQQRFEDLAKAKTTATEMNEQH